MPIWSERFQLILARLFTIRPKTSDDLLTSDKVFIFLIFLCALFARAVEYITKMLVTMPVTDMPAFVTYKRTVNFVFNHIASISAKVLYFTDLRDIYIKMCINMKRTIRLTESDLHKIIEESVSRIINEGDNGWGAFNRDANDFVRTNQKLIQDIVTTAQQCLSNQGGDGNLFWLCSDYCQRFENHNNNTIPSM